MPPILHLEIPADQLPRVGWTFEQYPGTDYWTVATGGDHPVGGGLLLRNRPR